MRYEQRDVQQFRRVISVYGSCLFCGADTIFFGFSDVILDYVYGVHKINVLCGGSGYYIFHTTRVAILIH